MPIDFNNPFAFADPFGARPAAAPLAIPPDQVEREVGGLSGALGGGLQYLGDSLSKAFGGRAVRSLLGAARTGDASRLRDVLSVIPFSDALGITDPTQETTGKELLGYDKNDDSWTSFFGGLGTDILTDPGTFINPFGKTLQGIAAAKAGLLPKVAQPIAREAGGLRSLGTKAKNLFMNRPADYEGATAAAMRGISDPAEAAKVAAKMAGATAADVVDKPLRSLATFHVPFTDVYHPIGTGPTAQNIANNLGSLGDWAAYSPVGRAVAPLFDKRLTNKAVGQAPASEIGQRAARQIAPQLSDAEVALEGEFAKNRRLAETGGLTDPTLATLRNPELQRILEGQVGPIPASMAAPEMQQLAGNIRGAYQGARPEAAAVGREANVFKSDYGLDYTHRQATTAGEDVLKRGGGGSAFKPKNPADVARNPALDLPGGEDAVNALFRDPQAALGTHGMAGLGGQGLPKVGSTGEQARNHILERYFGWKPEDYPKFFGLKDDVAAGHLSANSGMQYLTAQGVTPTTATAQQMSVAKTLDGMWSDYSLKLKEWGKAAELPALVAGGAEESFKKGLATPGVNPAQLWNDIFANRPKLFADSPLGLARAYQMNEAASNLGAKGFSNVLLSAAKRGYQEGGVSVADVLKDSAYANENMTKVVVDQLKKSGAIGASETEKALRDVYLPAAVAEDLTRFGRPFQQTRETRPIWKAVDTLGNLNKVSQTTVFPLTIPTILRNALTEGYTNLRQGFGLKPWQTQAELRGGGAAPGLTRIPQAAGMSVDDATKLYRDLAYQHGIDVPFEKAQRAALVGRGAHDSGMVGTLGPLAEPQKSLWDMVRESVTGFGGPGPLKDKLKVRGVAGATETTLPPVKAAQEMMHAVDQSGRHAAFIGALEKGYEPAQAAEAAKWMRMGTEDLTDWERTWMTRLLPYYRWLRTSIPATLGDIAGHPGGLTGQMIRTTNALRQNEGFIPDYVGEGMALPIGERTPEGHQRYLSGFGLPFEELNKLASTGAHPFQRTLQQLAGNLNPLLKAPIEFMTGTQLYSGRHLDDLYARTGSPAIDQLLSVTPLSAPVRAASRLADTRKDALAQVASLLSPARFTDADMNRALIVQGRKMLESELAGNPMIRQFMRPYVPDEFKGQLPAQDERTLALYNTLRAMAREQFQPAGR